MGFSGLREGRAFKVLTGLSKWAEFGNAWWDLGDIRITSSLKGVLAGWFCD
jgi:hypothetical protein